MRAESTTAQILEVQQAIERLWLEGRKKSVERLGIIEATTAGLLLGDTTDLSDAISAAHKLAGTLGMFGLPGGSTLARKIEHTLESPELAEIDLEPLADMVDELRTSLESGPGRPEPSPPMADRPFFHLVGSDRSYVEALKLGAESRGFDVRLCPSLDLVPDVERSGVAVFDCVSAVPQNLSSSDCWSSQVLLVAVGAATDVSTRIALGALGVHLVMGRETEADRALELIGDELDRRRRGGRVRVVGPTPGVMSDIEIENWHLTRITADELFVGDNRAGDVVVLDATAADMAEAGHLCRSIRASPISRHLPVLVVLAGEQQVGATVGRLLAAGADDVSWEQGTELAQRVQELGLRMTAGGPSTTLGSSTLGATMSVSDRLDARVEVNGAAGRQTTVSFITPRNLTEVNERDGRDAGDELLDQLGQMLAIRFRVDDLAGRWGAGYVIVLDCDRATTTERLRSLVAEVERSGLELMTATAVLGEDGNDGETLIDVAARRCQPSVGAQESVVNEEGSSRSILLVEDDSLIATLVEDLLTSRGHQVEVALDGPTAATLLSHPEAVKRYKLVVLDVSLPGLDGFAVLRQMRRNQPGRVLPVVLVTARATEEEIVAGLDLGAVDHVAKPFSPLVLIKRLERALEL